MARPGNNMIWLAKAISCVIFSLVLASFVLALAIFSKIEHPGVPKMVYVNHSIYTVYLSASKPRDLIKMEDFGLCNCTDHWIQLDPHQSASQLRDTVWHEVNHALNNCSGEPADYDSWDDLYHTLIPQQLEVLQANPGLRTYLFDIHSR